MHEPPVSWEQAMMARVRAGDETALAAIYDRYAGLVHGIARRLLGPAAAADITQEVFTSLWERPERFDGARSSLRVFLALLARRRAIDALRSRNRATVREERAGRQPHPPVQVDDEALAHLSSERLRHAVRSLPDDQRRAIELAYFSGLTFREVALATGVPEGTAKSRLRLGLNRLAATLSDERERVGG